MELDLRRKHQSDQAVIDALPAPVVDTNEIAQVVSAWTGIPLPQSVHSERCVLLNLSKTLKVRDILTYFTTLSESAPSEQLVAHNMLVRAKFKQRLTVASPS